MRHDGRQPDQLRPVQIVRSFTRSAPGSVLICFGQTRVLCTASFEDTVPPWRKDCGAGWITAEYDILPGATRQRRPRNRFDSRTQEIQRLIGRALRRTVDLTRLGPRTIFIDCDVLEADGGTRSAAITGAYVALVDALRAGMRMNWWGDDLLLRAVAAVSVGLVHGQVLLDLDHAEDAAASVDCNLVMTDRGEWVEIQATAEEGVGFDDARLTELLAAGRRGIEQLLALQRHALQDDRHEAR